MLTLLMAHKNEFVFLFSNAHLLDLQQDTTDIKYDEMKFMQSIVDCNYIVYDTHRIKMINESIHSAFNNTAKVDDLSWFENIDFSQFTTEQCDIINNVIDILIKERDGKLDNDWLKSRTPICSKEIQVDQSILTSILRFVNENIYCNADSYKLIRDKTMNDYNPTQITVNDQEIFNAQLSSSPLGLSFVDTVIAVLHQLGLNNCDESVVYYMSYMLLDLLGVCKEHRKKVRFRNIQTDCVHSFFGSYCDCIVSNDVGMRNKSKTLYKLFNIQTQVYSVDEFISIFDQAIKDSHKPASECFNEIWADYRLRKIEKVEESLESSLTYLHTSHNYFGYFNNLVERASKDEVIIILHKRQSRILLVQEIEIMVNRIASAFNDLGSAFPLFNRDIEILQINEDRWVRVLALNDANIYLTILREMPMLYLLIKLKQGNTA